MIYSSQWNSLISEHFDILDTDTRRSLLAIKEDGEQQNMVLSSLAAKLYKIIVEKSTDIDYGQIPKSKGDITRIPNFVEIMDCLNIIRSIVIEYKDDPVYVDEVLKAIDNLKESRDLWEKAYTYRADVAVTFYETIALAIVGSTSLMISTSIEYIKDPSEQVYTLTLDKVAYTKTQNGLLFKNIKRFNKAYKSGDIRKTFEAMLKVNNTVRESVDIVNEFSASAILAAVISAGMIVSLIGLIIPILHELVCLFFCAKQKVSDYFSIQADLLAMNAESVKLDVTKTESKRNDIYKRQMKLVDRFKKISNKLAVKIKGAEKRAESMVKTETQKYKLRDVVDNNEGMSPSSMF